MLGPVHYLVIILFGYRYYNQKLIIYELEEEKYRYDNEDIAKLLKSVNSPDEDYSNEDEEDHNVSKGDIHPISHLKDKIFPTQNGCYPSNFLDRKGSKSPHKTYLIIVTAFKGMNVEKYLYWIF